MPSQINMLVNILQAWKYNAREAWVRIRCSLPKAHVYLQRPASSGEAITGLTNETVGPAGDILPRVMQVCGSRTSELLHLQWGGASAPLSYSLGSFINSLSRLNVFICFGTSLVCSRFAFHRDNHFTNIQLQTKRSLSLGFGTQCHDAAWFPYVLHGHKLIKGKGCSVQFLTVSCVGSSLRPHPCLDLSAAFYKAEHSDVPPSQVWPAFPGSFGGPQNWTRMSFPPCSPPAVPTAQVTRSCAVTWTFLCSC